MDSPEKLERAFKANGLINNEFFQECLSGLETRYTDAWKAARTLEAREDAHKYIRLIEWFRHDLQSIANTGTIEEQRLAALEARERPPLNLAEFKRW